MKIDEVQEMTIEEFFDLCEKGGKYQIDTPDGWQDINYLVKKKNKECYNIVTEDGEDLGCSDSHEVFTKNGWKKSIDIDVQNDEIKTKNGYRKIVAKEYIGIRNTFDLNINSYEHSYYSNGIISHNCGKSYIAKAISGYWESPLLRLDMGKLFQSHVGESEQNARAAIKLAEAVAPCVIGSTEVIINGAITTIEQLFDKEKDNNKNELSVFKEGSKDTQYVVYIDKEKDIKIRSMVDNNIQNITLKAITKTFKKEKLIKIRTKSGKKIVTTNNHLLMVEKELKKVSDFKLNDSISIVNNEGIEKDEITMLEVIDFEGYVYDACCEGPHLYITNSFISHNCILWVDEIEKSISGGQSSGRLDSGVTSRVLSTFLTWLQEKDSSVFVVATANDQQSIPPEFLRAGRFDEIFFVDLPNLDERKEIFEVHLRKKKLDIKNFDPTNLATASNGYSGAEIEKSIENAMLIGFDDDRRKIGTIDILNALNGFKPLSVMREGEFEELRDWAKNRCVKASLDSSTSTPLYSNSKSSKDLEV